jgi:hypothetical protein
MSDDRLIIAIGRLERALSRIEAKGSDPARAPSTAEKDLGVLQERHRLLRSRTQAAIDRLDRLIGGPPKKAINGDGHR